MLLIFIPTATRATVTNLVVSNHASQRVTNSVALAAGQSAKLIDFANTGAGPVMTGWFDLAQVFGGTRVLREFQLQTAFYGPCVIEFVIVSGDGLPDGSVTGLVTLDLNPAPASLPIVPSNAVVIPADSAGPVTILLESSADLITWNAALPGQYGTSTSNRFFRVRAIR